MKKAVFNHIRATPVVVGLVALMALFSVLYYNVLQQAKADALHQLSMAAEIRSRAVENWLASRTELVGMLRTSIENIPDERSVLPKLFVPSVQEGKARNTFVIYNDGTYIDRANSFIPAGKEPTQWIHMFLDGKRADSPPTVDPIHVSPLTGLPAFSVSAPLRNEVGDVYGVVGVSYPLEVFSFFTSDKTGGFGNFLIFTGDKKVISPLSPSGQLVPYKDVPGIMHLHAASVGRAEGAVEISIDGEDHIFVFFRIRGSDWVFAASSSREHVYSGLKPLQNLFLAFFIAAVLCTGYLLYRSWSHDSYKNLSESDLLTEAGNRLALERVFKSLRRKGDYPVTMMMCDMDNLKIINDNLGHEQGDIQIKRLVTALRRSLRASDEIFRLGGDEFAAILPGTSKRTAELLVGRAMRVAQEISHSTASLPPLSMSIGIAVAESEEEVDSLYNRADAAMYRIKAARKEACTNELMAWFKQREESREEGSSKK